MAVPTASIVIPTHDRPSLLALALRSALGSLPEGAEVVVVDDGSRPPAAAAMPADLAADARLRVISRTQAGGAADARNAGVAAARGEVVFFLDDDDLLVPGYVAAVLARVAGDPALTWGFSPVLAHAEGTDAQTLAPVAALEGAQASPPYSRRHLGGLGCGFWIRAAVFRASGGIDAALRVNEDTEFCLRLLAAGHAPFIADQAGVSLLRATAAAQGQAGSVTRGARASDRAGYFARILDRHAAFLAGQPALATHLRGRWIKMLVRAGQGRQAWAAARGTGEKALVAACWLGDHLRPVRR